MTTTSYAYIHCKPDGVPFYVGKGALRRANYLGERNQRHQYTVAKYGAKNILIGKAECSSDKIALALEIGLIKFFRAMGVDLANYTNGGEGTLNPTPESRQRMSDAAKKRGVSEACHQARVVAKLGIPISAEQKKKLSTAMTGKVFTEEHRKNISISAKARGISKKTLEKAHSANRGRVHSLEERLKRGAAISKTLQLKKLGILA